MSWTGMTAITADQFPTKLGFAMGLQETFAGVGFMIGTIALAQSCDSNMCLVYYNTQICG